MPAKSDWQELDTEEIVREVARFSDFLTDIARDIETFADRLVDMANDGASYSDYHKAHSDLGWGQEVVDSLQTGPLGAPVEIDDVVSMIVDRGRWVYSGDQEVLRAIFGDKR